MSTAAVPDDFEVIAETEADGRGRVSLGRAGARPGRRYAVAANPDGVLLLTPVVSIPERELPVWQDPELAAEIREAIAEAEAGRTVDMGDFSKYLDDAADKD
jgi:hypothetical protein